MSQMQGEQNNDHDALLDQLLIRDARHGVRGTFVTVESISWQQ